MRVETNSTNIAQNNISNQTDGDDERHDPFNYVSSDVIINEFLTFLKLSEIATCCLVSKKWNRLSSADTVWRRAVLQEIAFGKKKWETFVGDVGYEPPLPKDIVKILKSPCPIWGKVGKKVYQTHSLMLIPETVDGKPLTLKYLGELVKAKNNGNTTQYYYFDEDALQRHGSTPSGKSYWVLITNDVLPNTKKLSFPNQQALIAQLKDDVNVEYRIPKALEAAVLNFMIYVNTGKRPFGKKPSTATRCQEKIDHKPLTVGGLDQKGLSIDLSYFGNDSDGVAGVWNFQSHLEVKS